MEEEEEDTTTTKKKWVEISSGSTHDRVSNIYYNTGVQLLQLFHMAQLKKGVGLIVLLLDGLVVVWYGCFVFFLFRALFLSLQPLQPPPQAPHILGGDGGGFVIFS